MFIFKAKLNNYLETWKSIKKFESLFKDFTKIDFPWQATRILKNLHFSYELNDHVGLMRNLEIPVFNAIIKMRNQL